MTLRLLWPGIRW